MAAGRSVKVSTRGLDVDTYTVTIGTESFEVPLRTVGPVRIAYLDFLCDLRLIRTAALAVSELLTPGDGAIVVPATGAIPLGYAVATLTARPFVVLRKGQRGYMGSSVSVPVSSVASTSEETLLLEEQYLHTLRAAPSVLLDTVTTSGNTLRSMRLLMDLAAVPVAATVVAFVEGEGPHDDILRIGTLPVF